jgi:hypothetical protein
VLDVEQELTALGAAIEWPATPDLRGRVLPKYGEVVVLPIYRAHGRGVPRWALVAAAAILIVITLAFTWLGLHTVVYRVPRLPTPPAHSPGKLGSNLDLGTPTTVDGAQGKVSWKIALPPSLGAPDAVYLKLPPAGPSQGEVTLVYAQRPGIDVSGQTGVAVLVTEARGSVSEIFFQKMLGPDSTLEPVTVNGHSGYWISGHPHDFVFRDASGNFYTDQMRLATNTLIFDDNGTIVRIEGDLTKAQALAIASSIA